MFLPMLTATTAHSESAPFITDGDSLRIKTKEIRLFGIDAPDYHQKCKDADNKAWACGVEAQKFLSHLIGKDGLHCEEITTDRYKRSIARCYSKDGKVVAREMVKAGLAVAYLRYTKDYRLDERQAQQEKRGIWQGDFVLPEVWRYLQYRNKK
jgi:endonuclease YncB( thermonuclease family)